MDTSVSLGGVHLSLQFRPLFVLKFRLLSSSVNQQYWDEIKGKKLILCVTAQNLDVMIMELFSQWLRCPKLEINEFSIHNMSLESSD